MHVQENKVGKKYWACCCTPGIFNRRVLNFDNRGFNLFAPAFMTKFISLWKKMIRFSWVDNAYETQLLSNNGRTIHAWTCKSMVNTSCFLLLLKVRRNFFQKNCTKSFLQFSFFLKNRLSRLQDTEKRKQSKHEISSARPQETRKQNDRYK